MACYRCAEPFKFFKKEIGCGSCGFSFCSKCCNNKVAVPKKDNKTLAVCSKCYDLLTNKKDDEKQSNTNQQQQKSRDYSPPKALLKLAESNAAKSSIVDPNKHLYDRLENLHGSDQKSKANSIPTEDEIEKRLRQLQGMNLASQKLSNLPTKEKIVTSDDLIKKFTDEIEIDKTHENFERFELEKLENRLKNLKSTNLPPQAQGTNKNESESHERIKTSGQPKTDPVDDVFKKMLEAEEKRQKLENEDEDLWCIICNGDGDLRCNDCDSDIYCKRCYKLTHQDNPGYKNHKKVNLN